MANTWKPNEKQDLFLKILKENKENLTLEEISKIAGVEIKSGSINTLLTKGLVEHGEEKEIEVVVKRKVKTYKLVNND